MTTRWLLAVPALALAVLGAHFARAGDGLLVAACLALIALLAWPRPWALRSVQIGLLLGAAEWLRTAFVLVQQRMALGQPWLRLAAILGAVVLLSLAAAALLQHPRLRAPSARSDAS